MQVVEAVTLFTDIVQFPGLQKLDFGEIPRTIRFRIFQMIPKFTELRVLIIGPGTSGAWIPIKVSVNYFYYQLFSMSFRENLRMSFQSMSVIFTIWNISH